MSEQAQASFGHKLRREREARHVTLEQLGRETGIDVRYLEALERDDVTLLPGRAFGKFFVRVYAEVLDFDPRPLLGDYERAHGRAAEPGESTPAQSGELRRVEAALVSWRDRLRAKHSASEPEPEPEPEPEEAQVVAEAEVSPLAAAPGPLAEPARIEDDVALSPARPQAEPEPEEVREHGDIVVAATSPSRGRRIAVMATAWLAVGLALAFGVWRRSTSRGASAPPNSVEPAPQLQPSAPPSAPPRVAVPSAPPPAVTRPALPPSKLTVTEFGVGRRLVSGRLEGQASSFEPWAEVRFLTLVVGGRAGERIRHVWLREGRTVHTIELRLGGSSWRTSSTKRLSAPGSWSVEARDAEGHVLATAAFVCE